LTIRSERDQDLRGTCRDLRGTATIIVDGPELSGLAVGVDQALEGRDFSILGDDFRDHGLGGLDQQTGLTFVLVGVPVLLLVVVQGLKKLLGDDILDGNQLGLLAVRVVDQALATILIQHRAVVVRDDLALVIIRVEVKTAEGLADVGEGFEALERLAAGREDSRSWACLTLGLIGLVGRGDGHLKFISSVKVTKRMDPT